MLLLPKVLGSMALRRSGFLRLLMGFLGLAIIAAVVIAIRAYFFVVGISIALILAVVTLFLFLLGARGGD